MRHANPPQRQRGAVLIVALLFLVILTMLGVTAMTSSTFEERMAGNARDQVVAFQAAEAALRDARRDINGLPTGSFDTARLASMHESAFGRPASASDPGVCKNREGRCQPRFYDAKIGVTLPAIPADAQFSSDVDSVRYSRYSHIEDKLGFPVNAVTSKQPRYIIELFCLQTADASIGGQASMCKFYRLTARGWGNNPNTQVTLQEIFLKL